jgi:predicted RNA-binding Zn-ribbon protein involved in translation (DUF1610 family)
MKLKIKSCSECGVSFNSACSKHKNLCPDCGHKLHGTEHCENIYDDGRCSFCFWESGNSTN